MATSCSSRQKTNSGFDNDCNRIVKKHIGVALGLGLSLTLLSVSSVSSATPQAVGTKCVKAGAFRTAKSVKYQCKKSAQGLRWVMASSKSTTTTTTTLAKTTTTCSRSSNSVFHPDTGGALVAGYQYIKTDSTGIVLAVSYHTNHVGQGVSGGNIWSNNGAWGNVQVGGSIKSENSGNIYYPPACTPPGTSTVTTATTTTTTPTPINTNVVTDATRFIQSLIDNTPITNTKNKTKIVMHVEPGKNGPYPDISENALTVALNFYASLGIVLPQDTIHVLLGRTQNWLREQANIYAPGCVNSAYKFDGNASLCAYPNRSAIYSHLPTAVTMNRGAPDDIDLSSEAGIFRYTNKKIVDSFAGAAPHEAHHAWQDGSYGNASDVPKWLWEGGASLFGEMIYARLQSPTQSYLSFDPGLTGWGKSVCKGPIETMKPVCEYTQGLVVMEYFLYKLGVESYIRLITQGSSIAFPVRFENATKVSLLSFYADVNKYLNLKGWND